MEKKKTNYFIGIDFGEKYSSVAIYKGSGPEILKGNSDDYAIPSYVFFTDDEIVEGEIAKDLSKDNPGNAIYDSKFMLGRKFDDPVFQERMKKWPFKVISSINGEPFIEVKFQNKNQYFSPEDITSLILKRLKKMADEYLSTNIENVMIAVPADWRYDYRRIGITRSAAQKVGLNAVNFVYDPIAVAIAYKIKEKYKTGSVALVFDFGGNALKASLLQLSDGDLDFEILSSVRKDIGGEDFDNNLSEYIANIFNDKRNIDLHQNYRSMFLLNSECEKTKKILSNKQDAILAKAQIINNLDLKQKIKRREFEKLNSSLFDKILEPVYDALTEACLKSEDIDVVLLAGGTSKIPKVGEILGNTFKGKVISNGIDPEQAIVFGAVMRAKDLFEEKPKNNDDDDVPFVKEPTNQLKHSIGVKTGKSKMNFIFRKGQELPANSKPFRYRAMAINQTRLRYKIYIGENQDTNKNEYIGEFIVDVNATEGEKVMIEARFEVDENGTITVVTTDPSGQKSKTTIKSEKLFN
ncbi:heat shock 70 kDa protein [Histomonas meleagridis]|uniref:heat shock 70 kDa protein n=1 Tax=Histomonas meleagridis TaxID=135588 RepID=UPI003559F1F3|nr:heat shock 70 kDa protein [Histomonas meleagridis]KAH0803040.1 heat shock 70 kDa protein [Histomonas meleagridis]